MHRQGYDVQLTQYDERGWRATFYVMGVEHSATSSTGVGLGADAMACRPARGIRCIACCRANRLAVHFLFPHIRVELLIRTMLTREWDDETWPIVRQEFVKALALRSRLRKAGWWN
jgi:hypothetical protein